MSNNEKNKSKYKDSQGSEILGTIIFTVIIMLLMWGASIWLR